MALNLALVDRISRMHGGTSLLRVLRVDLPLLSRPRHERSRERLEKCRKGLWRRRRAVPLQTDGRLVIRAGRLLRRLGWSGCGEARQHLGLPSTMRPLLSRAAPWSSHTIGSLRRRYASWRTVRDRDADASRYVTFAAACLALGPPRNWWANLPTTLSR